MASITECWSRFESFLPSDVQLPTGASESRIASTETATGLSFPPDLREFYSLHNGTGSVSIFPDRGGEFWFLSVEAVAKSYNEIIKIRPYCEASVPREDHPPQIKHGFWLDGWLQITDDGCGDCLFVDFDPGTEGCSGQIVDWWHEGPYTTLLATDFLSWFDSIVKKLENGSRKLGKHCHRI